jgi:hypothetical protein
MRNHRFFGAFTAVLLGTGLFLPRPSASQGHHHQAAGPHISGPGIRLASAALPTDDPYWSPAGGQESPRGLLRPFATRYLEASWAWSAYVSAHPPAEAPARPTSAVPATYHVAPSVPPATGPPVGEASPSDLRRPFAARYLEAYWAWSAYVAAHPPAKPPAPPTPAAPATYHAAPMVAPATSPAVGDVWSGLRRCESGGNYAENTGNGYYGAYQFSAATWHGLGFPGLPSDASPAVQDRAAQQLQARSGWGQWPACSRRLRLI